MFSHEWNVKKCTVTIVTSFIYLFLHLSKFLTFYNDKHFRTGTFSYHVCWNLGHMKVYPTVFNRMGFYSPFYTSFTTTKHQIQPLHVNRVQIIISMTQRSIKGWEKDEERMRKEVTANRKRFLSVPLLFLNYSSHSGRWFMFEVTDFLWIPSHNESLATLENTLHTIFHRYIPR